MRLLQKLEKIFVEWISRAQVGCELEGGESESDVVAASVGLTPMQLPTDAGQIPPGSETADVRSQV